jgi:hypothetical protein
VVAATVNEAATLQMIGGVPTWVRNTTSISSRQLEYQGGKVFYISSRRFHSLVCAIETHGLMAV